VRSFCRGRISDYKIPHAVVVADIPRSPSGKVLKRELREHVLAMASAQ
jgi:fatty-acyl-CoA synthase